MGMFDYVVCKMPLPDGIILDVSEKKFQTKSFHELYEWNRCGGTGGSMSTFIINEDGSIDVEWANYGFNERLGDILYTEWINDEWLKTKFEYDKDFYFYTSTGDFKDNTNKWHEFKAIVKDKKVVDIIKCEEDRTDI